MSRRIVTLSHVCSFACLLLVASNCSDDDGTENGPKDASVGADTSTGADSSLGADTGSGADATAPDVASGADAASSDAASAPDTQGGAFWDDDFNAACALSDDGHNVGKACLTCHDGNGRPPQFTLGGSITTDEVVEVGVRDGTGLTTVCTGDNGNFYLKGSDTVDWANAEIRLRSATGETTNPKHPGIEPNGNCNNCHEDSNALTSP